MLNDPTVSRPKLDVSRLTFQNLHLRIRYQATVGRKGTKTVVTGLTLWFCLLSVMLWQAREMESASARPNDPHSHSNPERLVLLSSGGTLIELAAINGSGLNALDPESVPLDQLRIIVHGRTHRTRLEPCAPQTLPPESAV